MSQEVSRVRVICIALITVMCLLWIRLHPTPRAAIVDFIAPFLIKKKDIERSGNKSILPKAKIELIRENEQLTTKVEKLNLHLWESRKLLSENSELRRLMELPAYPNFNYVPAEVIGQDPASGGRRVRVNRGAVHSVKVGQIVLANGFLYGRVLETSNQTALVLTIIDPNCRISVNIAGTNIHGILFGKKRERWKIAPTCIIQYLPRDFKYKVGMKVETSALGVMVPARIPVGELVANESGKVTETVDNLYRIANLKPLDLFKEINYVMILAKEIDSESLGPVQK